MKIREYVGNIVTEGGAKIVQWPEGIEDYGMTAVEVHFAGEKAVMKVYEPEPSYGDIKEFIKKNVGHYNPAYLDFDALSDTDKHKYLLIDMDSLAEFIKRYFIDGEGQGSFPCKY